MIIVHSRMTRHEALGQNPAYPCPQEILDELSVLKVRYRGFDGDEYEGRVVVHKDLAHDVSLLFDLMRTQDFPVERVIPIVEYGWDDDLSMAANNSSGFNYRTIAGTDKLSFHAHGRAIDINPMQNPVIRGGVVRPEGAEYNPLEFGTFCEGDMFVHFMKSRGWQWGGDWDDPKDYHHFQKPA